jgi:hypothetical protein
MKALPCATYPIERSLRIRPTYADDKSDLLFRKLIIVCRWLRDSSVTARWRSFPCAIGRALQKNCYRLVPLRALTALIIPAIQEYLFSALYWGTIWKVFAGWRRFGCGYPRRKAVKDPKLNPRPGHLRQPGCHVGAGRHRQPASPDSVATELLQGTEELRRAAAEALANNPEEGHPALADGSSMPDLLVRRAVVYGLVRVRQPWALQLLEKMQVEDEQWVVRSAATQALEEIHKPDPRLPGLCLPCTNYLG